MNTATLMGMALRYSLPASAILAAACAGGGGSFSGDFQDTQDQAPNSLERTAATNKQSAVSNEGIASTTERPGNTSGGAGTGTAPAAAFSCLGTFKCSVSTDLAGTKSQVPTTTLRLPGVCNYQGSGLNPDGTVTKEGKVLGTWQVTSNGFRVTESATTATSVLDGGTSTLTINVTLDCTKISDSITGDDDDDRSDDDDAPPPTSSFDAGAR